MDQNTWIMFFAGIAAASGLFALGIVLYPRLKRERQGYPFEAELEAALLPIIFQGVCAAYRLSEQGVDELQQRLKGADKKKIADNIYRMLPDKVGNFDLTLIKRVVSHERFEQLVQDGFDRFNRFYVEHQAYFDDLFATWKSDTPAVLVIDASPVSAPTLVIDASPSAPEMLPSPSLPLIPAAPVATEPPSLPLVPAAPEPPSLPPVPAAPAAPEPRFGGDFSQV